MNAPLPSHLEGVDIIHGYHPDPKRWETACGRTVVPFGPVSPNAEHVTCPECIARKVAS